MYRSVFIPIEGLYKHTFPSRTSYVQRTVRNNVCSCECCDDCDSSCVGLFVFRL